VRIVVVGGSVAGVAACRALRRDGWTGEIVLVGEEPSCYDRPPLSKGVLVGTADLDSLELADARALDELGVAHTAPVRAESLDLIRGVVGLEQGELAFDGLVLATGAHARHPSFPATGIHLLRTLSDAAGLRDALRRGGRAVVVGAGFIGLEVASSARELGLEVTVLEYGPQPMARVLPAEVGQLFTRLHAAAGSEVRCGVQVVGVEDGAVHLADGEQVRGDVIVVGVGAAPNDAWLTGSGLTVSDGVVCDGTLRAAPRVYAIGDLARWNHPLYGSIRMEHWTGAQEHARVAAANLIAELSGADGPGQVADAIPYFWSDQLGMKLQMAGWTPGCDAVHFSREGKRHLILAGRDDRLMAAITLDWPRELALHRRKLAHGIDFATAVAEVPGTPVELARR
jgi:NADPH-dependent 2,4-dienoyl-CoA reductase/sulfur reductase-like enzyme